MSFKARLIMKSHDIHKSKKEKQKKECKLLRFANVL